MKIPVQAVLLATVVVLVVLMIGPSAVEAQSPPPPAPGPGPAPGPAPAPAAATTTKKSAADGLSQPSVIQLLMLIVPFLAMFFSSKA
nr:unnamed protein product [Callosobruchus analis]